MEFDTDNEDLEVVFSFRSSNRKVSDLLKLQQAFWPLEPLIDQKLFQIIEQKAITTIRDSKTLSEIIIHFKSLK